MMAAARAYKRGETDGEPSEKIKELAASMTDEELTDFMKKAGINGKQLRKMLDSVGSGQVGNIAEDVLQRLGFRNKSIVSGDEITEAISRWARMKNGEPTTTARAVFSDKAMRDQYLSSGMVYPHGVNTKRKDLGEIAKAVHGHMRAKGIKSYPGPPKHMRVKKASVNLQQLRKALTQVGMQRVENAPVDTLKKLGLRRRPTGMQIAKAIHDKPSITTEVDLDVLMNSLGLGKKAQTADWGDKVRDATKEYGVPVAALAGAGVAGKGVYDLHRLQKLTDRIGDNMKSIRESLIPAGVSEGVMDDVLGYKVPLDLSQADAAVNAYNKNLRDLAHSRIYGMRSGNVYRNLVGASDLKTLANEPGIWKDPKKVLQLKEELARIANDPSTYLHHTKMFGDPNVNVHGLRGHLLAQGMTDDLSAMLLPNRPGVREMVERAVADDGLEELLYKFRSVPREYGFISQQHVNKFADDLRHIMRTEGKPVGDVLNYLGGQKALPDQAVSYLTGGSPDSISTRLKYLMENPQAIGLRDREYVEDLATRLRKHVLGGKNWKKDTRHVGTALDMLGDNVKVIGRARPYAENVGKVARKGKYGLAAVGIPAAVYAALSLVRKMRGQDKEAQALPDGEDSEVRRSLARALPFLAAAPAGMYGASQAAAPRDIATTYGTMSREFGGPNITGGHKNPAVAIREILQDKSISPWYSRFFNVSEDIVRGPGGVLNRNTVNPNVLIDTGFGALARPGTEDWVPRYLHQYEDLRPMSVMSYQTDMAPSSLRHAGATSAVDPNVYRGKREVLGYGPNVEDFYNELKRTNPQLYKKVKLLHLGNSMGPAVMQSSLDNASRKLERGQVIKELMEHYTKDNPDLAKAIGEIGNNKLVTISGSSRGDYVAQRAAALARELRERGVNDVRIVAQLGDALNDPVTSRLLKESPEVIQAGRMPNKLYTALQAVADIHSASSGASAAAEAATLPSVLSLPKNWGQWPGVKPLPGTPAADVYREAIRADLPELLKDLGVSPNRGVRDAIAIAKNKELGEDLFSYTGRMVSGDTAGLPAREADAIRAVREAFGGSTSKLKEFSEKLTNLLVSGDVRGWGDRLAPTADWNEGIVQYLRNLEGSTDFDPKALVDLLQDPKALAEMKQKAATRAASELSKLKASRKALNNAVYSRAMKNYLKRSGKGIAGILAALGLTGIGAHNMLKDDGPEVA